MDTTVPTEAVSSRSAPAIAAAGLWVRTGKAEHRILEMTDTGFVIAAEDRPRLRGFADILRGRELVGHGLVVCSWHEDGRAGYEFKRRMQGGVITPDHAPAPHGAAP